ncbi:MAG: ABC transporter permease [Myxococcales bacterium]|nr:ABC transporter permease [Myxococcales bacterium]
MRALFHLAVKDLRLLARDRFALFWVLAFPLVFAVFFGAVFGGGSRNAAMSIAVVDEAKTTGSGAYVDRLAASDALKVTRVATRDEAAELVRKGELVAYVRVTPDFGDSIYATLARGPDDGPAVEIGVDPSRKAEQGYLQGLLTQGLFQGFGMPSSPVTAHSEFGQIRSELAESDLADGDRRVLDDLMVALEAYATSGLAQRKEEEAKSKEGGAESGFAFGENMVATVDVARDTAGRPRSAFEVTFPSAIVWGLMGCAMSFAGTMVRERRTGTLLRLRVAPISRAQLLAGKALACLIACVVVSLLLVGLGALALGVRIADPPLLLLSLTLAGACFTGFMLLASMLGKTEASVTGGMTMIMMPMAMLGGGMIPLITMPEWMLSLSHVSPFKWSILAIEGAIWRDFTLADVALPAAVLVGLATVTFGLGVYLFRRADG